MNPQILQLLSGVSSLFGLLSILAYFYTISQGRRAERSVREIIEGEPIFNADRIVEILRLFGDDAARLKALTEIANVTRENAERLLAKIEASVDVGKLQAQSDRHRLARLRTGGIVLVILGVIGLIWSSQNGEKHNSETGTATHPPIPLPTDTVLTSSTVAENAVLQQKTTRRVALMDSPLLVYDARSRSAGRTNADDISDALKDIPGLNVEKENTSLEWNREEHVRLFGPHLIIIHRSAFSSATSEQPVEDRELISFLEYMADTEAQFIIYSRTGRFANPVRSKDWIAAITKTAPKLKGRIHAFGFENTKAASFRDPVVVRKIKMMTKAALGII